ncbi:MAG: PaaI family thioesterase [Planctomycetota bacterium]
MRVSDLPFNRHIGILDEGGVVSMGVEPFHMNHVGTVHATAIFGVAEAGSGRFIIENFGGEFPDALAVTRVGTIKYKLPAREDIVAEVTGSEPEAEQVRERLRRKGAAKIAVEVRVLSKGEIVAVASFDWFLKKG